MWTRKMIEEIKKPELVVPRKPQREPRDRRPPHGQRETPFEDLVQNGFASDAPPAAETHPPPHPADGVPRDLPPAHKIDIVV